MSYDISSLCGKRVFGSAVRKQIIMFLADKASDDGSGVYCSKGTVAKYTELSASSVKRSMIFFLEQGILLETGRRQCANGYTVIYQINLEAVRLLPLLKDDSKNTGFSGNGVQLEPTTSSCENGVPGSLGTPNHPKTFHKPLTRADAREEVDLNLEAIWNSYPNDRRRNKSKCLKMISKVIKSGVDHSDLLAAVKKYAKQSAGYSRCKVSMSDNWFSQSKWEPLVVVIRADKAVRKSSEAECRKS